MYFQRFLLQPLVHNYTYTSTQELAIPELLQEVGNEECPEAEYHRQQGSVGLIFGWLIRRWLLWRWRKVPHNVPTARGKSEEGRVVGGRERRERRDEVYHVGDAIVDAGIICAVAGAGVVCEQGMLPENLKSKQEHKIHKWCYVPDHFPLKFKASVHFCAECGQIIKLTDLQHVNQNCTTLSKYNCIRYK